MFKYWYGILDFEITLLMFVRSLREANFMLFTVSIKNMVPMFLHWTTSIMPDGYQCSSMT